MTPLRRFHAAILWACILTMGCKTERPPTQVELGDATLQREKAAVERIERLGGRVFPETVGSAVTLHHADTAITDAVLAAADGVIDLASLSLIDAHPSPGWLVRFRGEPHLRYIALAGGRLSIEDVGALRELPALEALHLIDAGVTDDGLAAIVGHATGLRELTIAYGPITDSGIAALQGLPKLRTLRLVDTGVSARALSALVKKNPWLTIEHGGVDQIIKGPWTGK